jgi:hypothetical protein
MKRFVSPALAVLTFGLGISRLMAYDAAEVLSLRIPNQRYRALDDFSVLQREKMDWFIPLWTCDASSFKIVKVLGSSAPAPYAVEIAPKGNNPIDSGYPSFARRYSIHLLSASLGDATKIRQALIREVEVQQRNIEKRHGNPPGHLKQVVSSWKK